MKNSEPNIAGWEVGVEQARRLIAEVEDQVRDLSNTPVDLDTALSRVDDWLETISDGALKCFPFVLVTDPKPESIGARPTDDHYAPLLWLGVRDKVGAALKAELRRRYAEGAGITPSERQINSRELDRRLLDLNLTEESLVRAAEGRGVAIHRRGTADPRAVLAPDEALPR